MREVKGRKMLNSIKTVVEIIQGSVTAVAVLIGAAWAYFKFVRGRTFKPRLEVTLSGQWHAVMDSQQLQARVTLKNIGASNVVIVQKGTGLRVSRPAAKQDAAISSINWEKLRVWSIFKEHQWIEPGETVLDDLLLDLHVREPHLIMLEARIVCRRSVFKNIVVFARRIIATQSTIASSENEKPIQGAKDELEPAGKRRPESDEGVGAGEGARQETGQGEHDRNRGLGEGEAGNGAERS